MSNLDKDLAEAKRLGYGVWYGRYKADHPGTPVVKPEPEPVVEEEPPDAVCDICGKPFLKYNYRQKYCSRECSEEANRRRSNAKYRQKAPFTQLTCSYCVIVFLPSNRAQKFCSSECQRLNEIEKKREKRMSAKDRKI